MNITFTVASVLENARQRMAIPAFSASTNVTQSQSLLWLNQSLESLQALTRQKLGGDYDLLTTGSLSTTTNSALVTLPAICGEMHDLLWVKDATTIVPLEAMTKDDLTTNAFDPGEWTAPPRYRLEGNSLRLSPVPNQAYALQIWFTNHAAITATGDTVTGRLDWSQWLELDLCAKCCQRKRRFSDVAMFEQLKTALAADMFSRKRRRDQNAVHQVRDVGIYGEWDY